MKLGRKKRLISEFYRKLKEKFPQSSGVIIELTDSIHSNSQIRINIPADEDEFLKILAGGFEYKINHTCSCCGKTGEMADPFCMKCEYRLKRKYAIKKINTTGFSVFKNLYRKYQWISVRWDRLDKVELSGYDTIISLKFTVKPEYIFNKNTEWEEDSISIFEFEQGFYSLLKNIPDHLFSRNSFQKKKEILDLESCGICGYRAKNKNKDCLVCGERYLKDDDLSERMKLKYTSMSEINKSAQIRYHLQAQAKYRYPKREEEFTRDHQYKILFSKEELQEKQKD